MDEETIMIIRKMLEHLEEDEIESLKNILIKLVKIFKLSPYDIDKGYK